MIYTSIYGRNIVGDGYLSESELLKGIYHVLRINVGTVVIMFVDVEQKEL